MPRRVHVWNGHDPDSVRPLLPLADALPALPPPRPLARSVEAAFRFGDELPEVVAIAAELVTTAWGEGAVTWLYAKAVQSVDVRPGETVGLHTVLVPVRYVVGVDVGPTFTPGRSGLADDLCVFPPDRATPEGAVPLAEVERVLAELHAPGLN